MVPGRDRLATPGSAVRHASVARNVTDCATRPGKKKCTLDELVIRRSGMKMNSHLDVMGSNINLTKRCAPLDKFSHYGASNI